MGPALEHLAAQTAGMLPTDLAAVMADAAAAAAAKRVPVPELLPPSTDTQGIHEPIGQQLSSGASAAAADSVGSGSAEEEAPLAIGAEDFEEALSNLRQRTAIAIGAPQACCSLLSPATVCAFQLACLLND